MQGYATTISWEEKLRLMDGTWRNYKTNAMRSWLDQKIPPNWNFPHQPNAANEPHNKMIEREGLADILFPSCPLPSEEGPLVKLLVIKKFKSIMNAMTKFNT
jgi:hypothetical protein